MKLDSSFCKEFVQHEHKVFQLEIEIYVWRKVAGSLSRVGEFVVFLMLLASFLLGWSDEAFLYNTWEAEIDLLRAS